MNYLPQNCNIKRPNRVWTDRDRSHQTSTKILNNVVPFDPNKPYDMKLIIEAISDRNYFYEIMPDYARNIITGFAEVEGRVVGVVAN